MKQKYQSGPKNFSIAVTMLACLDIAIGFLSTKIPILSSVYFIFSILLVFIFPIGYIAGLIAIFDKATKRDALFVVLVVTEVINSVVMFYFMTHFIT